jgi:hypothetical protein
VITPDGVGHKPIPAEPFLFTAIPPTINPQSIELTNCASEGEMCEFNSMGAVKYHLGWDSIPSLYSVATNGMMCAAGNFGSLGGAQYMVVAGNRTCAGPGLGQQVVGGPNWPSAASTNAESKAACEQACTARSDCTHYIWRTSKTCETFANCVTTGASTAATYGYETVVVNKWRAPGYCASIPISSPWGWCADSGGTCNLDQAMVVRFGLGSSFKYVVAPAGPLVCGPSTFGLAGPGENKCDMAVVGVPARIGGPYTFVEEVELYVRPRNNPSPECLSCDACRDADGRIIRKNVALHKPVAWEAWGQSVVTQGTNASSTVDGHTENTGIIGSHGLDNQCSWARVPALGALTSLWLGKCRWPVDPYRFSQPRLSHADGL